MSNNEKMMAAVMALPPADLMTATKLNDPIGAGAYYRADTVVRMLAAERERIRALVQAVRDANRDAEDGGETFRLLKPGQERAWMALLAGLDGPNVANNRPGWAATEE